MTCRIAKYFGTSTDSSGNNLFWPGSPDGFPVRGPVNPMMHQEEYEGLDHVFDAKVRIFELPRDIEEYESILDRIANGWYMFRSERTDYDSENKTYRVLMQWIEVFGVDVNSKSPGAASIARNENGAARRNGA